MFLTSFAVSIQISVLAALQLGHSVFNTTTTVVVVVAASATTTRAYYCHYLFPTFIFTL